MLVTYDLTQDDYLAFIKHLQQPYRYAPLRIALTLFLGMVVPVWFVAWYRPVPGQSLIVAALALVIFGFALAFMAFKIRSANRLLLSEDFIRAFCGQRELTLEPDGLREKGPARTLNHQWRSIERISKNDGYLFIHSPGHQVSAIPIRAFQNERVFQELATQVATQTGKQWA